MAKSTDSPSKRKKVEEPKKNKRRRAPGKTIESRENQLINAAVALAEKQMRLGSASSQVITHFLKLGSTLATLEKAKLDHENQLLQAKTEALKSAKRVEDLYANALSAMRSYSGQNVEEEDSED
jgi:hypothetical protein